MTHILSKRSPQDRFVLLAIHGNCLEKAGVHNMGGGYAIIDQNLIPQVGDLVHCLKGQANVSSYIKQVKRIEGDSIIVGTAYYDESKNFEFEASEILGVVIETYSKIFGNREYVRPSISDRRDSIQLAEEIFAEIETILQRYMNEHDYGIGDMLSDVNELENKYMKECAHEEAEAKLKGEQ